VKTVCGCREEGVQTKEKYKLRLTTKAYKLSYNYINYTINPVGRPFGKWRRRRLRSGGSRRVRRMPFGCAVKFCWASVYLTKLIALILGYRSGGPGSIPGTTRFSGGKKEKEKRKQ
jgi:hypothetical protein